MLHDTAPDHERDHQARGNGRELEGHSSERRSPDLGQHGEGKEAQPPPARTTVRRWEFDVTRVTTKVNSSDIANRTIPTALWVETR